MKRSLYGQYPGKLKYESNYIKNCSEMELFIQVSAYYEKEKKLDYLKFCEKMEELYYRTEDYNSAKYFKDLKQKTLEECKYYLENKEEIDYALDFCILETARFDTKVAYNPEGRVKRTEKFKEWYENWQLYVETMDPNTLQLYRKYRYESTSLDIFSPNKPITSNDIEERINNLSQTKIYQLGQKNIKQNLA